MLNDTLKFELFVHLNGQTLNNTCTFKGFDIVFLSEVTFLLKRETFSIDDKIFDVLFV